LSRFQNWFLVTAAAVIAVVFVLYGPVLGHELRSDDFQWVHQAHRAQVTPSQLFADLDSFYRPLNTWSLVADRMIWGSNPSGYHLTNLVLHVLAALGLAAAARRLGLSAISSSIVAVVWAGSPFTEEAAIWISARFQDFLMIGWTGLIVAWPRKGEEWSGGRRLAVLGSLLVGAAAKESWVVMPMLGAVLEFHRTDGSLKRVARAVAPLCLLSAIYVAAYFLAFPGDKDYYSWTLGVLAKLPHMFAAFLYFEELLPMDFNLTWRSVLATAGVLGAVVLGLRRRSLPVVVGAAWLGLATLPVLLVAFLPTRHTLIPYAGVLLIAAATFEYTAATAPQRFRRAIPAAFAVLVVLIVLAGGAIVRADLVDYGRVSRATARLLDETREVLPELAFDRPMIVVRGENESPLHQVTMNPHGRIKIWYPRHADPYGLVDAAALFDWILGEKRVVLDRIDDWPERLRGVPGTVVVHRDGGFTRLPYSVEDTAAEAQRLTEGGYRLRVVWAAGSPGG